MLFRHNAKADAFGVDRWLASLQHDMCYDYPCFVILERREGTNICICRGRSCACPLLALVLRGYKRELRALRATKGPKSGRVLVLFALLGGHAGTAPTVSVLCYLFSVLFRAPTRDTPTVSVLCSLLITVIVNYFRGFVANCLYITQKRSIFAIYLIKKCTCAIV